MTQHKTKKVKLALQGGGSFGAFTWGVIDRLLEDDRIEIVAASGASAGAMNAVAMAQGMDRGGRQGARDNLRAFWEGFGYHKLLQKLPKIGKFTSEIEKKLQSITAMYHSSDKGGILRGLQSYFQAAIISAASNSSGIFEKVLSEQIDFEELRKNKDGFPVFVSATDIDAHAPRVFDRSDLNDLALKASCAIPMVIGSVEIDGREYWDGSFTENPAVEPMDDFDGDLIFVQTFPILDRSDAEDDGVTPFQRLSELSSNSSLRKDINRIQKDNARYDFNPKAAKALGIKKTHTHLINCGSSIDAAHMMNFDPKHIDNLYKQGYEAADKWLAKNFASLGVESTYKGDTVPDTPSKRIVQRNQKQNKKAITRKK